MKSVCVSGVWSVWGGGGGGGGGGGRGGGGGGCSVLNSSYKSAICFALFVVCLSGFCCCCCCFVLVCLFVFVFVSLLVEFVHSIAGVI